jgi:hypothetical protein
MLVVAVVWLLVHRLIAVAGLGSSSALFVLWATERPQLGLLVPHLETS